MASPLRVVPGGSRPGTKRLARTTSCDADVARLSRPTAKAARRRIERRCARGQRRSVGRAASPDGARCVADPGVLFRLAGAAVPDGTGLMEVRGGTFAPDPVADPDLEAEEGGAVPVPA